MADLLLAFGVWVGLITYLGLTVMIGRYVWRRTSGPTTGALIRMVVRASVLAFFASPTFAACGALAPVPFPMLMFLDAYFPGPACGQLRSFAAWNLLYVVTP